MACFKVRRLAVRFVGPAPIVCGAVSAIGAMLRLGMGDRCIVVRPALRGCIPTFLGGVVRIWVDRLILKSFDEDVKAARNEGAQERANPIDPMVAGELSGDDARAKGTGWVKAAACVKDTPIRSINISVGVRTEETRGHAQLTSTPQ